MAIFAIRKRTSLWRANFSATSLRSPLKKACAVLSSGTVPRRRKLQLPQSRGPALGQRTDRCRCLSGLRGLAVAQRLAGFWRVVVPEPQRFELFLLGPQLIERVALE